MSIFCLSSSIFNVKLELKTCGDLCLSCKTVTVSTQVEEVEEAGDEGQKVIVSSKRINFLFSPDRKKAYHFEAEIARNSTVKFIFYNIKMADRGDPLSKIAKKRTFKGVGFASKLCCDCEIQRNQ